MSSLSIVGYVVAIVAGMVGLGVLVATGWVVTRSGVVRGLKEAADGWEVRATLLAANLQDCHHDAATAAALATGNAAAIAETHRIELGQVRDELSAARERIAVLEAKTDLDPIREWLIEHNGDALARHEAIVAALNRIAPEAPE